MLEMDQRKGSPIHDESDAHLKKDTDEKDMLKWGEYDCKDCTHCCEFGSGYVLQHDIPRLSEFLNITGEELKEKYLDETERFNKKIFRLKIRKVDSKPYGQCILVKKGEGCTVHKARPLYCRIATCGKLSRKQLLWFDLNHVLDTDDPEAIRQWVQNNQHKEEFDGARLQELIKDKDRLKKILSYERLK